MHCPRQSLCFPQRGIVVLLQILQLLTHRVGDRSGRRRSLLIRIVPDRSIIVDRLSLVSDRLSLVSDRLSLAVGRLVAPALVVDRATNQDEKKTINK